MGKITGSNQTKVFFKALSIFGSVEVLKLACGIVRTKLVAIWIGTVGVGIMSLYNSTLEMVKSVSLLNLRQSSIPAIASAEEDDRDRICSQVELLGFIIGIIITVLVIGLSPLLSLATFGNYDYSWGFALLAPTMLANSLSDVKQAVMQGLRRFDVLAKAVVWTVVVSTIVTIPLFYFFRLSAIVPSLIIFPVVLTFLLYIIPGSRIKRVAYNPGLFRETVKALVKLGSYLTIGIAVAFIGDYLMRIYLNRYAGAASVGLFQAGVTLVNRYVGIFFTVITMEYFPRLSARINRTHYTEMVVAHEINISLGLLVPVVILFISLNEVVVRLLYSSSFLDITPYITIGVIATVLRAVSWCFSYVIVAKGDGRIFVMTESISVITLLILSYIGWNLGSWAGLGWAFVGQYAVYTIVTWGICRYRYGIRMPSAVINRISGALMVCLGALLLRIVAGWWAPLLLLLPIGAYWFVKLQQNSRKKRAR